jgi:tetratricopeptide (TPR) repeat protein
MTRSNRPTYRYQAGGSLGANDPTYVYRQADEALYERLKDGDFCYVFNCRQMGKSSLGTQIMGRLIAEGICCVRVDLSAIGTSGVSMAEWYRSLIEALHDDVTELVDAGISEATADLDLEAWQAKYEALMRAEGISAVRLFNRYLKEILLVAMPQQRFMIFIDEIDAVLDLEDSSDFFGLIRACFNRRADDADYQRLTFALFGVATPGRLIRDVNKTPFNLGKAIVLTGFELERSLVLTEGMNGVVPDPVAVLREILAWTGGQPFLTQKLCDWVQMGEKRMPELVAGEEAAWVAQLVEQHLIANWKFEDDPQHFRTIENFILRDEREGDERKSGVSHKAVQLLGLYQQVLQVGELEADESEAQTDLCLSGLVVRQQGKLRVYNRIYQRVFDLRWVEEALAEVDFPEGYLQQLQAWLETQDERYLLQGNNLATALEWADGKRVREVDNRFLMTSQTFLRQQLKQQTEKLSRFRNFLAATVLGSLLVIFSLNRQIEPMKNTLKETDKKLRFAEEKDDDAWDFTANLQSSRDNESSEKDKKIFEDMLNENIEGNYLASVALARVQLKKKQYSEAEKSLKQVLQNGRNSAMVWSLLGGALSSQNKLDEAVQAYREVLKFNTKKKRTYATYIAIGIILYRQNKLEETVDAYQKALELVPRGFRAYNGLGLALGQQSKLNEAIAAHRKAIELNPEFADAYNGLGLALGRQSKLNEAIVAHRKAIELNPEFAGAYYGLGLALRQQNKLDEAVTAHRKAIELNPEFAGAYNRLGLVLRQQNKLDEAVTAHRKAIELNPELASAYNGLGLALRQQNKLDEAVTAHRKAIELNPEFAAAYNGLGLALRQQNKLDEAVTAHRKAIELNPRFAAAYSSLGGTLKRQNKLDESINNYKKAIDIDPNLTNAYINLGDALFKQKNFDEAVDLARKAIKLDSNNAVAYSNLGDALREQGKLDEAAKAYDRALALPNSPAFPSDSHPSAYTGLGNVFYSQNKLDEAIENYRKAIELDPQFVEPIFNLGKIYHEQGNDQLALEYLDRSISLNPKNQSAIELQQRIRSK